MSYPISFLIWAQHNQDCRGSHVLKHEVKSLAQAADTRSPGSDSVKKTSALNFAESKTRLKWGDKGGSWRMAGMRDEVA